MGCECGSTKPARTLPKPWRLAFTTWRTTKRDLTSSIFAHINHRQFVFFGCNTNKFAIKLCSIVCLNIFNGFYSASQTHTCTKVKIKLTTKSWQKLRADHFRLKENREMQWVDGSTFEVRIPAQTWSLNCQVSKTYERAPRTSKTSDVRRSTFITKRRCLNSLFFICVVQQTCQSWLWYCLGFFLTRPQSDNSGPAVAVPSQRPPRFGFSFRFQISHLMHRLRSERENLTWLRSWWVIGDR